MHIRTWTWQSLFHFCYWNTVVCSLEVIEWFIWINYDNHGLGGIVVWFLICIADGSIDPNCNNHLTWYSVSMYNSLQWNFYVFVLSLLSGSTRSYAIFIWSFFAFMSIVKKTESMSLLRVLYYCPTRVICFHCLVICFGIFMY